MSLNMKLLMLQFGVAALHDACRLGATDIVRFMLAHKDIDPNILEQVRVY